MAEVSECYCPLSDTPACCAYCNKLLRCRRADPFRVCEEAESGSGCRNIAYKMKARRERLDGGAYVCDPT